METEAIDKIINYWQKAQNNVIYKWVKQRKAILLYSLFGLVMLVLGLFYAFTLPFAQVPDELTHYQMMEEEFGTTGYVDEMISRLYFPAGLHALPWNYNAKVDTLALQSVSHVFFSQPLSLSSFHPKINAIRHLPSGIGFYLGIAMELPILWCACLAEIFSVLFYVGIGIAALRMAPVKKDIFAFCLLMPMTLQQCSSVNYDAVLIPCSFLLFAYILKLFYSNSKIRWRNLLVVFILTIILLIIKPPYILIALSILIIPLRRYRLKLGKRFEIMSFARKYKLIVLVLVACGIGVALYVFRNNSSVALILSDILEFPKFISLLIRTYRSLFYTHIIQMVGRFGWLDSSVSSIFIILFFIMLTYLSSATSEMENTKLTASRRVWLLLVFIASFLLIEIAMQGWSYDYLEWGSKVDLATFRSYIAKLNTILGVQGRYWIPILPILLISLSCPTQRKHREIYWFSQFIFYAISFQHVMIVLVERYWG